MSVSESSKPLVLEIHVEGRANNSEISYDVESNCLVFGGCFLLFLLEAFDCENIAGRKLLKGQVIPTDDEWNLLWKVADRTFLWGIRGGNEGICLDGSCERIDLEIRNHLLQTSIYNGGFAIRWGLFLAALYVVAGKSGHGIVSGSDSLRLIMGLDEAAYERHLERVIAPDEVQPSKTEILSDMIKHWDEFVVPPGSTYMKTAQEWHLAAQHWNAQNEPTRRDLCREMGCSIEAYICEPNVSPAVRPWWAPEAMNPGPPCPACRAPLRTELAKQCFRCGADWH